MSTREIATKYRLAQWAQAMQERTKSGESIKEFCQNRGISRNAYFYWQCRLREAALAQAVSLAGETQKALAPSGWSQVIPAEETEKPENTALSIEIGKYRVIVGEGTNPDLLAKACRVLVSLC